MFQISLMPWLRMFRMLRRRHVDVAGYARVQGAVELGRQLRACEDCRHTAVCDRALKSRAPSRSSYSFCPNRPAIERYLIRRAHIQA